VTKAWAQFGSPEEEECAPSETDTRGLVYSVTEETRVCDSVL
jgi:hypothetical protein